MDARRWPRIRELFERALDLPMDERGAFVERESDDEATRHEVLRLLGSASTGFEFLKPPSSALWRERFVAWQPSRGERVGSFVIQRALASGGMGTVYEALQEKPARAVALKMMHAVALSPDARRRFEVEAEILARLRHPGIAAIYELGAHRAPDGSEVPFFAMEYVEGARDVVGFAGEHALDLRARIELFREVCAAVQYAHQKGVIHRDLKPGNVLVDASGRAKVIDYGVARVSEADFAGGVQTRAGDVLGTLQYMSPEQLQGSSADIDTRSDVYALGVILYELVTGRPPYALEGRPFAELVASICERAPAPPSQHAPELAREIDWIVLRALAKERERRYATAAELSEDLARYLRNEAVLAGPPTRRYRVTKFVARNRMLVAASALGLLSLLVGLAVATRARNAAEMRRIEAEAAQVRASNEAENARIALRRQTAVVDALDQLIRAARPDGDGRKVTVFELLERKRSELDLGIDDPEVRVAVQFFLVQAYYSLGVLEPAAELAESALAALEHLPDADPFVRKNLNDLLARIRVAQSRVDEARALQDASAAALADDPDASEEDQLYALRSEALMREASGHIDESIAAYRELLQRAEGKMPLDDPLVPMAWAELATLLVSRGEVDEAETLARKGYQRALDGMGPDSPYTAIIAMRLGTVLCAAGKTAEALPLQRDVAEHMRELFGEAHTNTLQALEGLANTLRSLGQLEEAEQVARRTLELVLENHPDDSFELEASTRSLLADILGKRGDRAGQVEQIRAAIDGFEERGQTHQPHLVELYTWLAALELVDKHDAAAETLARRAVELGAQFLPASDTYLAKARARLGHALLRLGRAADAERELSAAHAVFTASPRADFQAVEREVVEDLAAVHEALGNQAEAARYRAELEALKSSVPSEAKAQH